MKNIIKYIVLLSSMVNCAYAIDHRNVNIHVTNGGDSRITNLEFARADMLCSGGATYKYAVTSMKNASVSIGGDFYEAPRSCKLPDDEVYFILHNLVVNFEYDGVKHDCVMAADVGTSIDKTSGRHDKLQSYIMGNPTGSKDAKEMPGMCIGNPQFTYKIIQGTRGDMGLDYQQGRIEIHRVGSQRLSDKPINWTFFVNGIMNSIDGAMISSLRMAEVGPSSEGQNLQYGLLYNRSHGIIRDTLDLSRMKEFDSYIASGKYIKLYEDVHNLTNCESKKCQHDALDWYLTMVYTENGFQGWTPDYIFGNDFSGVWGSFLSYGINPTDKIMLVAHSQGNLYANVLTDYLKYNQKFPTNNINILHVGVTSARTNPNTGDHSVNKLFTRISLPEYVTNKEDHIINAWRASMLAETENILEFLRIMPVAGNFSYGGEVRLNPKLSDTMNHSFTDAYLNHRSTYAAISNMMYKIIAANEYDLSREHTGNSGVVFFKAEERLTDEKGFHRLDAGGVYNDDIAIYPPGGGNTGGLVGAKIFSNYGCKYCSHVAAVTPNSIAHGYYQIFTSPTVRYFIVANKPYDTVDCGVDTFELAVYGDSEYTVTCGKGNKVFRHTLDGSGVLRFTFFAKDSMLQPADMHLFYAFNYWSYASIVSQEYNVPLTVRATKAGYNVMKTFNLESSQWIQRKSARGTDKGGVFDITTDWLINTINTKHGQICEYYPSYAKLVCPFVIRHFNDEYEFELSAIVPYGKYSPNAPLSLDSSLVSSDTTGRTTNAGYYRDMFEEYSGVPANSKRLYMGFVEPDTIDED